MICDDLILGLHHFSDFCLIFSNFGKYLYYKIISMRKIEVDWIGVESSKKSSLEGLEDTINDCTSEHDGVVKVIAFSGNPTHFFGKRPFLYKNEIYLSVFTQDYILIFEENSLNIKELIFIYDNEVFNHEEVLIDAILCKYLIRKLGM